MTTRKALIVDDSSTARHVLGRMLKQLDMSVQQADSGERALEMLHSETPDILFLDHIMPGMDGFQVLKAIKSNPETEFIPVIMYTSQAASKYKDEAKALGASGVISKQLEKNTLYATVENILDRSAQTTADIIELSRNGTGSDFSKTTQHFSTPNAAPSHPSRKNDNNLSYDTWKSLLQESQDATVSRLKSADEKKSFIRKYPARAAIVGLLLLLPILLIFSLYDRIEEQQTAQRKLLVEMQAFQTENDRIAEQLIEQVKAERLKLNEDRLLVSEMIVTLAEQLAANSSKESEDKPLKPVDAESGQLSEAESTDDELEASDNE